MSLTSNPDVHEALRQSAEALRNHPDADPHTRALAEEALTAVADTALIRAELAQAHQDLATARREAENAEHLANTLKGEDRFAAGYDAARRHYRNERGLAEQVTQAWRDPQQDRGCEAIRRAWPDLAAALDATAAAADEARGRA